MTHVLTEPASLPPRIREPQLERDSRVKELAAILGTVVLADLCIYRGHGFAGLALFFVVAAGLLWLGKPQRRPEAWPLWIVAGMLALLAVRLLWYGSILQVCLGLTLLMAFATALDGHRPFLVLVLAMASQTIVAGGSALLGHLSKLRRVGPGLHRRGGLNIVLPALALLVFGTLFVLANPNAVTFVGRQLEQVLNRLSEWFVHFALRPTELLFWIVVAWITAGLLRPILDISLTSARPSPSPEVKPTKAPLFTACRNTLATVIGLFAVYLVYEFYALWTRQFPEGFYYAGYAHQGAAWLTVALALATLVLSLVFSGPIPNDPRVARLRWLAWIWSIQNLLLSLAVYNRLFIYIDFNGMTRMRIVGLFGISVVVAGFLLVVWKIVRNKDFSWLVQRQIWALAAAVYLFALTPVDGIAASYNVRRVMRGDSTAAMQLGVHALDLEGTLALPPLLDCPIPEIRDGAAALIAKRYLQLQESQQRRQSAGWTAHQFADRWALERFQEVQDQWQPFLNAQRRERAIQQFHEFAYQWY